MASTVWGIDLGTTYSCIARVDDNDRPVVIPNIEGDLTTPSAVFFTGPDEYVVGKQALRQAPLDPDNVCILAKRHMGEPEWRFRAHGTDRNAQQVSALILKSLATDAAQSTGDEVKDVVITVPAYFGVAQRDATKSAGEIAGLNVIDIINEPTAAALSYGFAQDSGASETVLVYDLGGGTFDVSVVRLDGGNIEVIVTDGNHRLGGANWDATLVQEIATKFLEANPGADDPRDDDVAGAELRTHAEEAKRTLTGSPSVKEPIMLGSVKALVEVSREEFEAATRPLLDQTIELTKNVVREAEARGVASFDRVLLVGGSSFMPAVAARLTDEFGWAPQLEDPNQAVAKGAALLGQRADLRQRISDVLKEGGIDLESASEAEVERAASEIAPDVGMDGATALAIATTNISDVLSKGFGVAALKGGADPSHNPIDHPDSFDIRHLVGRNDPVPLPEPKKETFYTVVDHQTNVTLSLFEQGGSDLSEEVSNNIFLTEGSIALPGDDPIQSPLEVMFDVGRNGMLTVTLTHPRVPERLTLVYMPDNSAFMSDEEKEAAKADVASLTRR